MFAWRGAAIGLGLIAALVACDEEATRPAPARVDINYEACLGESGGAQSTCPATLDAQVAAGQNGCLILERSEEEFHLPFEWSGGGIVTGRATLDVMPGDTVSAVLFVFATADAGRCDGLSVGAGCTVEADCLVKLTQSDVTISDDTTFDFKVGGQCQVELANAEAFVETCDGLDNDCDGTADESLTLGDDGPAVGEECGVGQGECLRTGLVVCQGGAVACNVAPGPQLEEICDGLDNNCDGQIDENIAVDNCCDPGAMRGCGIAVGACTMGSQTCEGQGAKGAFGACVGMNGMPVVGLGDLPEGCNAVDDDCDGQIDEDIELADGDAVENGNQPVALGEACLALDDGCQVTGAVICGDDGVAMCAFTPIARGAEVCDGADNNCDGTVDEGFPGLGEACETGIGGCFQSGQIACVDSQTTRCNAAIVEAGIELCANDVDDDCDGTLDEGFDQLGVACHDGNGICRVNGRYVCSAMGEALVCDAEAGEASPEVCDQLDNDCDTRTDEGFDTTADPLNCGACDRNCDAIVNESVRTAVAGCEQSACVIVRCIAPFENQDGLANNGCECNPNFNDVPDAEFLDNNCDGIDGDPDDAYFVSALHGDDGNEGTVAAPFATLGKAIMVAAVRDADIYLDAAVYDVTDGGNVPADVASAGLTVPPRVSIYGGFRYDGVRAWARGPLADFPTVLTGAQRVLTYRGARLEEVFLANVSIVAGPPSDHPFPTAGVIAIDVGDQLILRNVSIVSEAGVSGPIGATGDDAPSLGASGQGGTNGDLVQQAGLGGDGGSNQGCNAVNGGVGGDGDQAAAAAQSGGEGSGAAPGSGGLPSEAGGDGQDGDHGRNSIGGNFVGRIDPGSRLWIPRPTGPGLTGDVGSSGGGGGGGLSPATMGGGGGGGGAGGCFGSGGRAAQGGSMSAGLIISGGTVHLRAVQIRAGQGGQGGRGGRGGAGELGLLGGLGGTGIGVNGGGGNGGRGGDGGCGGNAGGGGGGSSFAIFRISTSNVRADIANSQFVFEDAAGRAFTEDETVAAVAEFLTAGAPGVGGGGGGSVGGIETCGADADPGANGISAALGCCPVGVGANSCTQLTCN